MHKAVIYARVSTKDQEREGYSIPAQLRILREYSTKNGFQVVREFRESESAGKAGRKAFSEMLELLKSDRSIEAILVEKTDRLYRNFKDHVLVSDLGVDIHFVKDNRIIGKNSKPSDKFVHDIETAQAKFYLNNLSQEVKKGMDQKARQGKYPGGPIPIGYLRNSVTSEIVIDPERSPIVRQLFELYSDGEHSIDDLHREAKRLNLTYIKSGRPVARAEIERILKRVFYTGKFSWHGQIYQGDHPEIIDYSQYEHVQAVIEGRRLGKFSRRTFTFSRLIECGLCGNTITAEIKKSQYIYYHCTGYGSNHKVYYVPEPKIDRQFASIVGKVSLPYDYYEFLKISLEKEFRNRKIQVAVERDRLELKRDKIESDMRKAFQARIDGLVTEDFFKSVYNEYQRKLDAVNYSLANLSESVVQKFDAAMRTIELSHQAESLYLRANPDQKRRLLKSVLSNCHLNDTTLYPTYKNAFRIFAEGIESNNKRG